jgi:hypothetical protein
VKGWSERSNTMIKYVLEINLKVITDDNEIDESYNESGENPCDIGDDLDQLIDHRIKAGSFILTRKIRKILDKQ